MTPKYGIKKQLCYRNVIIGHLNNRIGKNTASAVTLGGAHCLERADSIENAFLNANRRRELTVVEQNWPSYRRLKKSLTNIEEIKVGRLTICSGRYKKSTVVLVRGTLNEYLRYMAKTGITVDVIVADYYCTLNYKVEKDIDIIVNNRLLCSLGSLFLTACDPRRASTQPACERIYGCDPNKGKHYRTGMRNFLRQKFTYGNAKLKRIDSFSYDNADISSKAIEMHVVDVQVA